jgi:hypothetical protein
VASAAGPHLAGLTIVAALLIAFPQTTVWLRAAPVLRKRDRGR